MGVIQPSLLGIGSLFDFISQQQINRQNEERYQERLKTVTPIINQMQGTDALLDRFDGFEGYAPGGAAYDSYRNSLDRLGSTPGFNLGGFLSGAGQLNSGALGALAGASDSVSNVLGRTTGAVNTAFDSARDALNEGRIDDTLAMGRTINEESGLNELFGTFTPQAEQAKAALAGRRAAQQIRQASGASEMSQGQSERGVAEVAAQTGVLSQQAADNARRLNMSVAGKRADVLSSTAIPLEQINASLAARGADADIARGGTLASLGSNEAELLQRIMGQRADVFTGAANQLLKAEELMATFAQAGHQIDLDTAKQLAQLASEAELDQSRELEMLLNINNASSEKAKLMTALMSLEPEILYDSHGRNFATDQVNFQTGKHDQNG